MRLLALAVAALVSAAACGGAPAAPRADTCPAGVTFDGEVSDHGAAAVTGAGTEVQAGDSFFTPTCLTGLRAGTIVMRVRNTGQLLHNVTVPGQPVDVDVAAGQTVTVSVTIGDATIGYFCKYHRTSGMLGALLPQGR